MIERVEFLSRYLRLSLAILVFPLNSELDHTEKAEKKISLTQET